MNHKRLAGGGFVKIVCIQGGHFTLKGIAGGDVFPRETVNKTGDSTANVIRIQAQVRFQRNDFGIELSIPEFLLPLAVGTGSAAGVRFFYGTLDLQYRSGLGRSKDKHTVSKFHIHDALCIICPNGLNNSIVGFFFGHSAYIYTGDEYIVHDFPFQGICIALDQNHRGNSSNQCQTKTEQANVDYNVMTNDELCETARFLFWLNSLDAVFFGVDFGLHFSDSALLFFFFGGRNRNGFFWGLVVFC